MIIKRKRGNVIYIYEQIYTGIENGKRKYKEKCLGHLDEAGNLIPSKKNSRKAMKDAPSELILKTTETKKVIIRPKKTEKTEKIIPIEDEKISTSAPSVIGNQTSKPEKFVLDTTKTGRLTFDEKKIKYSTTTAVSKLPSKKEAATRKLTPRSLSNSTKTQPKKIIQFAFSENSTSLTA